MVARHQLTEDTHDTQQSAADDGAAGAAGEGEGAVSGGAAEWATAAQGGISSFHTTDQVESRQTSESR